MNKSQKMQQELFSHLVENHNLVLLETELQDIVGIVEKGSLATELLEALKEAKHTIQSMKLSMIVHPDCAEEGSEFDEITDMAQEVEDKISKILKNQNNDCPTSIPKS